MGGTSGEADVSEEVDILAVCLNSYRFGVWGGGTKMAVSQEPLVRLTPNLDTVYLRVCPTTREHHFCGDDVTGVHRVHKTYPGCIFWQKSKERYNLDGPHVFQSALECFLV